MKKIKIYWDDETNPSDPGWVWTDGKIYAGLAGGYDPDATDEELGELSSLDPMCPVRGMVEIKVIRREKSAMKIPKKIRSYLSEIGRKGGKKKSAAKSAAAKANGRKGGRPKKREGGSHDQTRPT